MFWKKDLLTTFDAFLVFIGNGINTILIEWQLDQDFTRFALFALLPLLFCVALVRPVTFLILSRTDFVVIIIL